MKIFNFTIIKLTICLVLGILIGYFIPIPLKGSLYFSALLLLLLATAYLVSRKQFLKTIWFGLLAFLAMISIGILTININNPRNSKNHYTHHILNETSAVNTITFRVREVLKPNAYYDKYVVDILQLNKTKTTGKSLLSIKKDTLQTPLAVDAILTTRSVFQDLNYPLNPYQFNYQSYLEKQYIYHQINIRGTEIFPISTDTHTVFGHANTIREFINKKLDPYHFKPDEIAVINALFLGQRQNLSADIYNDYRNAGAIHILAISGLHIGILLLILNWVMKPIERLKHGKLLKAAILVSILWSFAIIAGLSASITRAVAMFSIITIATNLKRPTNILNTLAISIFIILLLKPLYIFDVGFQLSYMAVFAIVTIDPMLYKLWQPKNKITDKFWHTITVSIAAQLGIAPLLLFYFHQFAGLFLVSSLIIPLLFYILGFGIIVILGAYLNILPQFVANFFGYTISAMNTVMRFISEQEAFIFNDIPFNIWLLLASYFLIISLVTAFKHRNYNSLKWILFAVISFQCAFMYTKHNKTSNEFIVFHKNRFSMIGNLKKDTLSLAHNLDSIVFLKSSTIKNYTVGNFVQTVKPVNLESVYLLKNKTLLVVDSLNAYKVKSFKPDYILLQQSPKINLNRLIDSLKPKQIIADGSNYKTYTAQWKSICRKRKLPFHDTHEKGAFILKY